MGSSQRDKVASHQRIVEIAAARIRAEGVGGVGVAEIMREAGLTHGGFYRHFESRDELVTEALALALSEGSVQARMAPETLGARALRAIILAYLSSGHRDSPTTGCAIAALAEDMSRAKPSDRSLYAAQVEEDIELLASLEPILADDDSSRAILTLSALVGALSIARAVGEGALSREVLQQTGQALMEAVGV